MKKSFFLITIIIFLFSANYSLAISGDCSWHGGINCSAGSDWDGSVICNDGWKDSTDSYYDAAECKNTTKYYCSDSEWQSLLDKYKISDLDNEILKIQNDIDALDSSYNQGTNKIKNDPVPMQFITGQAAALERQYLANMNALMRKKETAINNKNQKTQLIKYECEMLGQATELNKQKQPTITTAETQNMFAGIFDNTIKSEMKETSLPTTVTTAAGKVKIENKPISETKITFNKDLKLGNNNSEVEKLQNYLIQNNYLKLAKNIKKGYFGQITKNALIKYQKVNKLKQTGILDKTTREKINKSK